MIKIFQVKDWDKIKNNKLISSRVIDEKLLEKRKLFGLRLQTALLVYDDRYIKIKIFTYGDKVYIKFYGLNVPEDDIESESFTVISTDSLLVYKNKYYVQFYLDNCSYKIMDKQLTDYLDDNLSVLNWWRLHLINNILR